MIARDCKTILQCPNCYVWITGEPNDTGIVYGVCDFCHNMLAWGHEQDIEKGTFKGKSWIED